MKIARICIAFILVFCLTLPWCVSLSATAETPVPSHAANLSKGTEEVFRFGRSILEQMDNRDALLYAYDKLVLGCENASASIDISHRTHRLNSDEAFLVWELVTNDHPEFFWLAHGAQLKESGGVITTIGFRIPADIEAQQAALRARVAELTSDLVGKSDYEKSLILHDRVAEAVSYQYTDNDQTVIGSLLEGASVCAGYARAYQLLMQTVGIPVFFVTGYSKGQGHAWNLVQLDGEWYYTDVTWDDQNDDGGYIYYSYLNMTYARMCEEHTAEEFVEYLPHTTATAANYHTRHDTALETPNAEVIATLYEAGLTIRLYMTGDITTFFNGLNDALYGAADRVACIGSGFSCNMTYLGREIIIFLTVSRPHNYNADNVCKKCGYKKEEHHHYFITVIDPTCLKDGKTVYTCSYCGKSYFEVIPATGEHVYESVVTAPDCVNDGFTTYTCTACGDSYVGDATDALGHRYEAVTTDPTCAEDGRIVYTCADCGDSYSEVIPATGEHVYDNDTDADCNVCGEKREVTIPGDADGNGKVNNRDLGLLQRRLNGAEVTIDVVALDMDGNGKINNRDLGLLQKLLNR
ncbi:MAG: hypothetical protein IJN04_01380 [Clostridia bacterium]|nr:hypothetical protein [Clostridia bacterium]